MPRKRIWVYAAVLFIVTGTILTTQVSWIIQSARLEESFLNQRVNMALCSAMDVLSKDKAICSELESCVSRARGTFELTLNQQEKQKIDSVILQHLLFYNLNVPFQTTFSPFMTGGLRDPLPAGQALLYPLAKAGMQNILVHLEIPSQNDLIHAQINGTFILSIIMLGLLIAVFFSALRALVKERSIRKETVDFINTMAHDLKTPISNISFALSLFTRESQKSSHPGNQYISIIEAETSKLKQRAKQILGVASVDAVLEAEPNKTQIDMHKLIHTSTQSFSLPLQESKGEICAQLEAKRSTVVGSQVQLTSAVMNIIDNAIIYASGPPRIQIRTDDKGDSIKIEIKDNGPGIPVQEQVLIFKKGYRIRNGKTRKEGYGLGLYLARTLVEKQGGTLSLSSDGCSGSTFIIQLPLI